MRILFRVSTPGGFRRIGGIQVVEKLRLRRRLDGTSLMTLGPLYFPNSLGSIMKIP